MKCCSKITIVTKPLWDDFQKWEVNWAPLSKMIDKRTYATSLSLLMWSLVYLYAKHVVLPTKERVDYVIQSIITQMEWCCLQVRDKSVMKSILITSNFQLGISISWVILIAFWWSTLTCWQLGHLATKSNISLFKPFHQKTSGRLRYILVAPRWIE